MRSRSFGIFAALVALLLWVVAPVGAALAESSPVILLSGRTDGEYVVVTATLRNNDGIAGMRLDLEYDVDKLEFVGWEQGDALSDHDLIASGSLAVYPFVFTWSSDENDSSSGKLLTLRFKPREDKSGEAFVRFAYVRDRDVNFYKGGEVVTRNLLTDALKIELSSGEVTEFTEVTPDESGSAVRKKSNLPLILGLAVGGPVGILLVIGIPYLAVRKKRV